VFTKNGLFTFFAAPLLILACSASPLAQGTPAPAPPPLDGAARRRVIENIVGELHARYVLPGAVKGMEEHLRARLRAGDYDAITDAGRFAAALTQDLREASKDSHLFVTYDPEMERALASFHPGPTSELQELPPSAERLDELRQGNYGFAKVEILSGNVGYLDLREFVDLNYSREAAAAAMNFLSNTDAVIIDLRHNHGGFINLKNFIISYFYGLDPVELVSRYHRDDNVTVKEWSLREVPGRRLTGADLYILTSSESASAAEGFPFILQLRKRAKVVGEKTAGANYGNKETAVGDGFILYVSVFRQFDPRTGRDWQGVGVQPDIEVTAARALEVAHSEAVKGLAHKATDERRRRPLSWLLPLLELKAYGEKQVPAALMASYAGKYDDGRISVTLEQGRLLFLGASGVRRRLLALADDHFLIEDESVAPENQARVRFVKDPGGAVTQLRLLVSDGREFPRAKAKQ
jgi:hypothetical protein